MNKKKNAELSRMFEFAGEPSLVNHRQMHSCGYINRAFNDSLCLHVVRCSGYIKCHDAGRYFLSL